MLSLLGTTQDQADWFVLLFMTRVLLEPGEIQVHLAFIGGGERAELEINRDEAPQSAMEEQQIEKGNRSGGATPLAMTAEEKSSR